MTGVYDGSVAWGDYDNDGDLDILLTGSAVSGDVTKVYNNDQADADGGDNPNIPPDPPTDLAATVLPRLAILSWQASSDSETPAAGLTYNVRIGTTPGGVETTSPQANPADGYRRIVRLGNANHGTWILIQNLTPGIPYYWSVQAVDAGFAGSGFSAEGMFVPGDDADRDGIADSADNCPNLSNVRQSGTGVGRELS